MTNEQILRDAAQQALQYLEFCWRDVPMNEYSTERIEETINMLDSALAQPATAQAEQVNPTIVQLSNACSIYERDEAKGYHERGMMKAFEYLKSLSAAQPQPAIPTQPISLPQFNRRAIEREVERLRNPTGMQLNDGKERVTLPGGTLERVLKVIDYLAAPPIQPAQERAGCACKWQYDALILRCELHQAWYDTMHEWAERTRTAEAKLAQPAQRDSKQDDMQIEIDTLRHGLRLANDRVVALEAQWDSKDAERYRWMRDRENSLETRQRDKGITYGLSCYHFVEGIWELKHGEALDAAIDRAIAATQEAE